MDSSIGEVAERTGPDSANPSVLQGARAARSAADSGGRRRYDAVTIDRLYRVRLPRNLGTPITEVDPDGVDVLTLIRRHLAGLDARQAELARQRERVRTVEARLLRGDLPGDEELLDLLAGLGDELTAVRRLTLLVYRDIDTAQRHLVNVFGLVAGELTCDGFGRVVHGEVFAGDGVIWMHPESEEYRLASPMTSGTASHCMAVDVDDVDAHHARAVAAGAEVVFGPAEMPYGVREYAARDSEGGLWSFMQPVEPTQAESHG